MRWGYPTFTETCNGPDPDTATSSDPDVGQAPAQARKRGEVPNLITNVATTTATVPDVAMTAPIHQQLADKGLLPDEHLVDSGYPSVNAG
jgi:hypothetical protein